MRRVASDEVAAYLDLVEQQARKFVGRAGAEFEDLVQEGLICVWEHLQKDEIPYAKSIQDSMRDWVRKLRAQIGG